VRRSLTMSTVGSTLERVMGRLAARKTDAAALILLSLLVLCFMWRVVFLGKVLLPLDAVLVMEPWRSETADISDPVWNPIITDAVWQSFPSASIAKELRRGGSYFWDPYSMAGMPSLAAGEMFVHPVLFVLSTFTSVATAMSWTAVVTMLLGGSFTYLLLRELNCGIRASLIGSLTFTFNGYLVDWLCLPNMTGSMVWLPLIAWGIERSIRLRDWRWGLPSAVGFAMQISGSILWSLYGAITIGLLLSCRALVRAFHAKKVSAALSPLAYGAMPFVVGSGLAAISLLPTLQLYFHTSRTSQAGTRSALDMAVHALRLVVPGLYGNSLHGAGYRTAFNFVETNLYFGILPLFLILAAALLAPRRSLTWPLFGLGMAALLAVYGIPPFRQMIAWVYPAFLNTFPGRIFYVVAFCWSLLAGLGADWLVKQTPRRTLRTLGGIALAFAVMVLSLAGAATHFSSLQPQETSVPFFHVVRLFSVGSLLAAAGFLVATSVIFWSWGSLNGLSKYMPALAVLCVIADLFVAGVDFNPAFDESLAFPETPSVKVLRDLQSDKFGTSRIATVPSFRILYGQSPLVYGLQTVSGYSSWALSRYARYIHLTQPVTTINHIFLTGCCSPLLNALNAKYVYTPDGVELANEEALELIYDGSVKIYDNRAALPRAWVVHRVTSAPRGGVDEVAARLLAPGFDPALQAVVEGDRELPARDVVAPPRSRADIVRYEPERVAIETTLSENGLLVLSDAMYPGWTAQADGQAVPIYYTNLFMRGVFLGRGVHRVEFVYRPWIVHVGLVISVATVVFVIGAVVMSRGRRARRREAAGSDTRPTAALGGPPWSAPSLPRSCKAIDI
jgi:Bacterial membrane protein YfhO